MGLESIHKRVIILSRRRCCGKASVNWRLEAVFDSWCTRSADHMSAFEFGDLCRKLKLQLCLGDIFLLFSHFPGGVQGRGIDYQGFIEIIGQVGDLLKLDQDIEEVFAKA